MHPPGLKLRLQAHVARAVERQDRDADDHDEDDVT